MCIYKAKVHLLIVKLNNNVYEWFTEKKAIKKTSTQMRHLAKSALGLMFSFNKVSRVGKTSAP